MKWPPEKNMIKGSKMQLRIALNIYTQYWQDVFMVSQDGEEHLYSFNSVDETVLH